MKKAIKVLFWFLLVLVILAGCFLAFLTITEYKPVDSEELSVNGHSGKNLKTNEDISILSWNIGYSALGKDSDFAMDGGGNVPPADKQKVSEYFSGINKTIKEQNTDIIMIQELDINSSRSFHFDMREQLSKSNSSFAYNYKCPFVPFPWPPLAKIESGLFTTSDYLITEADRKSLPCPFSWPLRIANLKRCLLVSYFPIEGSSSQLVLINLHLEAYTEEEGRIKQLLLLNEFMEEEYKKGNYVIAGGDFNQTFPDTETIYPNTHPDNWNPNSLNSDLENDGFSYAFDASIPTCRLLNQPYNPLDIEGTQYYVIDGFITSPNVQIKSVDTINCEFADSDHNPVRLVVNLVK